MHMLMHMSLTTSVLTIPTEMSLSMNTDGFEVNTGMRLCVVILDLAKC